MKKKGQKLYWCRQITKTRFEPAPVDVIETGFDEILVLAPKAKIQVETASIVEEQVRQIVEEKHLHQTIQECAAHCEKLMRERMSAFQAQHEARMKDLEANIQEMNAAQAK